MVVFQYDIEKLNQTMQDFYNVTGININLLQADFSWTRCQKRIHNDYCRKIQETRQGSCACHCSDNTLLLKCRQTKTVQQHSCHAGLVDVAVPLLLHGDIIGYLILGQMKSDTDFSSVIPRLKELGLPIEEMKHFYQSLPHFETDKIRSIVNVAVMVAKYILLEQFLQPKLHHHTQKAAAFIEKHLESPLPLEAIAEASNCSKSALYRHFQEDFHCTVNEYINEKRLEKSEELLRTTDLSIEEIARATGFTNASYYSRLFKKQFGLSPLQYRKAF